MLLFKTLNKHAGIWHHNPLSSLHKASYRICIRHFGMNIRHVTPAVTSSCQVYQFTQFRDSHRYRWLLPSQIRHSQVAMEKSTNNIERTISFLLCTSHLSGKLALLVSEIYFFLSVATILGNVFILSALRKVSFRQCLPVTDLLVGLISEPASAVYFLMLGIQSRHRINISVRILQL